MIGEVRTAIGPLVIVLVAEDSSHGHSVSLEMIDSIPTATPR